MALAVVRKKQTASVAEAAVATEGATATAGNLLIAFAGQSASTAQIKFSDDKGETGWTNHATSCIYQTSASSGWLGYKVAVGAEKEIKATAGAGGTVQGVTYIEVSGLGATPTVDSIQKKDNVLAAKTQTTTALTTTDAEEIIFAGVFANASTGTVEVWTGTGPLTNVNTEATRAIGGYLVTAEKWTGGEATSKFAGTSKVQGSLIVAFKATAEGVTQVAGTTKIKFKDVGAVLAALAAEGITKVRFQDKGAILTANQAAAVAQVTFKDKLTVHVEGEEEEEGRRIVLMIFDE